MRRKPITHRVLGIRVELMCVFTNKKTLLTCRHNFESKDVQKDSDPIDEQIQSLQDDVREQHQDEQSPPKVNMMVTTAISQQDSEG